MEDLLSHLLDLTVAIQGIPAPTFGESHRGEYIRDRFEAENLCDIEMDAVGNVYGRLPGSGQSLPLVVSAHIDTVFPAKHSHEHRRTSQRIFGAGIGDNSLGVASLFGLLWSLRQEKVTLPGDLWLVGNVCEEGLGDLRGMRAVVDRFGSQVLGYIILEGMALGQVYHRGLGVRRYRITIQTAGGHSWVDYGRPSAIHEMAELITRLTRIRLPFEPRTTLNVGVISGGTTVNTVAAEAFMEVDLRSEQPDALTGLAQRVEALSHSFGQREGVSVRLETVGDRPAGSISPNHPLIRAARQTLLRLGIEPVLGIGSTDANIPLSLGLPAVCIGLTTGSGAHTRNEFINTSPVQQGLAQVVTLVQSVFRELA